jgi:hypothetical protein
MNIYIYIYLAIAFTRNPGGRNDSLPYRRRRREERKGTQRNDSLPYRRRRREERKGTQRNDSLPYRRRREEREGTQPTSSSKAFVVFESMLCVSMLCECNTSS